MHGRDTNDRPVPGWLNRNPAPRLTATRAASTVACEMVGSGLRMSWRGFRIAAASAGLALVLGGASSSPSAAAPFFFSTGNPDGKMALASRPGSAEIEAGDDFALSEPTSLTGATFTGLLPSGASLSSVQQVAVEIYRLFPSDSDVGRTSGPPTFSTPQVPTRVNSPSDVDLAARDAATGSLSFTAAVVGASFTANNSVLNGIHPKPNQTTGGDGAVSGEEVNFNVGFASPVSLPGGHYFFVPQVLLTAGDFFWLSAADPIAPPGTPFPVGFADLQAWIRNAALAPDWLRAGTDIVGGGTPPTFNATFSLSGATCPTTISVSPSSLPGATLGARYATSLTATGGTAPYSFTATEALPNGLSLAPNGSLSGIPTQAGSFRVDITATDSVGCQGSASLTLNVGSAPGGTAGPGGFFPPPGGTTASATTPAITSARLSNTTFRATSNGPTLARTRRVPVGTTVSYHLSQAATTTFAVLRAVPGHQSRGSCLAGRHRRHHRSCIRLVVVGSFARPDAAGDVSVHFSGRVRGRKLSPASYVLTLTPTAGGHPGRTIKLTFHIVR